MDLLGIEAIAFSEGKSLLPDKGRDFIVAQDHLKHIWKKMNGINWY
jgi:hypothetical protein